MADIWATLDWNSASLYYFQCKQTAWAEEIIAPVTGLCRFHITLHAIILFSLAFNECMLYVGLCQHWTQIPMTHDMVRNKSENSMNFLSVYMFLSFYHNLSQHLISRNFSCSSAFSSLYISHNFTSYPVQVFILTWASRFLKPFVWSLVQLHCYCAFYGWDLSDLEAHLIFVMSFKLFLIKFCTISW